MTCSTTLLDLTEGILPLGRMDIRLRATMSKLELWIPNDGSVNVIGDSFAELSSFNDHRPTSSNPTMTAPSTIIYITGMMSMSTVNLRSRKRQDINGSCCQSALPSQNIQSTSSLNSQNPFGVDFPNYTPTSAWTTSSTDPKTKAPIASSPSSPINIPDFHYDNNGRTTEVFMTTYKSVLPQGELLPKIWNFNVNASSFKIDCTDALFEETVLVDGSVKMLAELKFQAQMSSLEICVPKDLNVLVDVNVSFGSP
ncbi:hypothetical protein HDU76_008763 [Blyttiomyces sp. JEL0837]|nr:hypothetical protein HDU76_008763 [Blyttiomyces sp. JEL0837]